MDPHLVLGIAPGATPDEITAAYRRMAKRHHPDRSGDDDARIREINAAYARLRDESAVAPASTREAPARGQSPSPPGAWLAPALRLGLGYELLRALTPGEEVRLVAAAATWDAHDVRLVLTDRRLLWLRDDALTDRVRQIHLSDVARSERRLGRRGRSGGLRMHLRDGRRLDFAELRPEVVAALQRALQRTPATADTNS